MIDPTPEEVRSAAARGGLELTDEEAGRLVKGVGRQRRLVEEVRKYAGGNVEPAGVFRAGDAGAG